MTPQQWQAHMLQLRNDMRDALVEYRNFDARWNRLNDALNEKFKKEGRDILEINNAKAVNVTLQGHMSAAQWWRDKAQALAVIISAEDQCFRMTGER